MKSRAIIDRLQQSLKSAWHEKADTVVQDFYVGDRVVAYQVAGGLDQFSEEELESLNFDMTPEEFRDLTGHDPDELAIRADPLELPRLD